MKRGFTIQGWAGGVACLLCLTLAVGCASTAPTSPVRSGNSDSGILPAITPAFGDDLTPDAPAPADSGPSLTLSTLGTEAEAVEPAPTTTVALEEETEEVPPEQKHWVFKVEAGATAAGGNSKKMDLDFLIDGKRRWEDDELYTFARVEYGESENDDGEDERNENRITAGAHLRHFYEGEGAFYSFARQNFEKDEFADIRLRSETYLGGGKQLYEDEHHEVSAETGPGYTAVDYYNEEDDTYLSAVLAERWAWKISEKWSFTQVAQVFSNLEEFDDDFRTEATADLRTELSETIFLSFGLEHRYDAEPGLDDDGSKVKRQDWKAMIKLGVTF